MEALPQWTRLVSAYTQMSTAADTGTERAESLERIAREFDGDHYHTGGGIFIARVPLGRFYLAIVGREDLTLWATGQGDIEARYAVAYEQASGYEPEVGLRSDGTLYGFTSTDDNWWRCSADSVSAGMLVDLGDEAGRDGEPREVLTTQPIGNEIYLEFNDDDPGAKFSYDERVWVRDKALESTE